MTREKMAMPENPAAPRFQDEAARRAFLEWQAARARVLRRLVCLSAANAAIGRLSKAASVRQVADSADIEGAEATRMIPE